VEGFVLVREAYRQWLAGQSYGDKTQSTQWSQANRIEKNYGDLDAAYDADRFAAIRGSLEYSKDDQRNARPNPSKFKIDGDVYSNLASYRATLTYYSRFRESEVKVASGTADSVVSVDALERLKAVFLGRYADFASLSFTAHQGLYWDEERAYKETVLDRATALMATPNLSDEAVGQGMMAILQQPPANFVGWRTFAQVKDAGEAAVQSINIALSEMLRDPGDAATVAAACATKIHPLITSGGSGHSAFGEVRSLVTTALALVRPDEAIAVKTRYMQRAARLLIGRGPFKSGVMTVSEYRDLLSMAEAIFAIMRDQWGWAPKDLWDVQGFLWVTSDLNEGGSAQEPDDEDQVSVGPSSVPTFSTNLILYGPPGTGKTFATAERAVTLCDGRPPAGGREAIMARYQELVARKRISFVTFHQSYAYEDFVEGLRPETGAGDGETLSGGFSLRPRSGVFRQIASLAQDNHGRAKSPVKLNRDRQIFKMSLGRSTEEDGSRGFGIP
jgi:5-methylcytosine-specific restriction protein B